MKRTAFNLLLILTTVFLINGCGSAKKIREPESVVDSPAIHYDRGKDLFNQQKYDDALYEFDQANSLDPKYAPAYEGKAWIYLERSNLKQAEESANKALDLDGKWVLAKIVRAKIRAKQEKYDDAIEEAKDAIKDIPKSSVPDKTRANVEAYSTLGDIYKEAEMYDEAGTVYQQVLEIDNLNMKADKAIKEIAAMKTAMAGQRPELKEIASKKEITRSDVAVLFVIELPLAKIFRQDPQSQKTAFQPPAQSGTQKDKPSQTNEILPNDISGGHWAKSFIKEALEKGVMEVGPDGNFNPDAKVNRAEFAHLIQKFLIRYWNDPKLPTRFIGNNSPFTDVNASIPTFNAIMVVSTRGLISGYDDGTFKPLNGVSGTEALNIIRKLKADL